MRTHRQVFGLFAAGLLFGCSVAAAAELSKVEAPESKPAAAADEVARLVQQLDSPRFREREEASGRLAEIGKAAIPALAKAAEAESVEASTRAFDLLQKLLYSSGQAKDDAKAALEKLAKSQRPAAARRAAELLKAKEDEDRIQQARPMIGGAQIQVMMGNARRVSMRNINGVKEVEADDNGRKIKIREEPGKGIKIEVATKKDGKDVTDKYEAQSVEELQKKHPEGYKLYKEFGENPGGGVIQFQIQGGGIIQAGGIQIAPAANPVPILPNRVDTMERMLKSWGRIVDTNLPEKDLKTATPEAKERLRKQVEELRKQLGNLEGRLKDSADAKPDVKPEPKPEK
jgi:hypothetical protein